MCKPMPYKLLRIHNENINLNTFFGFIKCEVLCPTIIDRPILPVKYQGRTIYPLALLSKWIGTYFSEEIKAVIPLGYIIKPIIGYEFSKLDLFSNSPYGSKSFLSRKESIYRISDIYC